MADRELKLVFPADGVEDRFCICGSLIGAKIAGVSGSTVSVDRLFGYSDDGEETC
jgi:hypothetical protein